MQMLGLTYASAFEAATNAGASRVALCSIGTGGNGLHRKAAAWVAVSEAIDALFRSSRASASDAGIEEVIFLAFDRQVHAAFADAKARLIRNLAEKAVAELPIVVSEQLLLPHQSLSLADTLLSDDGYNAVMRAGWPRISPGRQLESMSMHSRQVHAGSSAGSVSVGVVSRANITGFQVFKRGVEAVVEIGEEAAQMQMPMSTQTQKQTQTQTQSRRQTNRPGGNGADGAAHRAALAQNERVVWAVKGLTGAVQQMEADEARLKSSAFIEKQRGKDVRQLLRQRWKETMADGTVNTNVRTSDESKEACECGCELEAKGKGERWLRRRQAAGAGAAKADFVRAGAPLAARLPHDPKGPPLAKKPANVASATKALPLQAKAGQQHKSGPLTKLIIDRVSPGDGKTFPQKGDTIDVHYTGKLLKNGHKFDSSRDRGRPISFKYGTGRVIRGWDEAMGQLSKGERARLQIPAAKAYGSRGAGRDIPPNADLVFDVELMETSAIVLQAAIRWKKRKKQRLAEEAAAAEKAAGQLETFSESSDDENFTDSEDDSDELPEGYLAQKRIAQISRQQAHEGQAPKQNTGSVLSVRDRAGSRAGANLASGRPVLMFKFDSASGNLSRMASTGSKVRELQGKLSRQYEQDLGEAEDNGAGHDRPPTPPGLKETNAKFASATAALHSPNRNVPKRRSSNAWINQISSDKEVESRSEPIQCR
eukprot:g685.t1